MSVIDFQLMEKTTNKNIGQLMELLDSLNCNDSVKKIVKTFFWKTNDEIKNLISKGE